jgi:phospholipid/cholesterol/gamma-HCH transport system permease protein
MASSSSLGPVSAMGQFVLTSTRVSGGGILLMLHAFGYVGSVWRKRTEILSQMLICGVYSLPVAMLVAMFTGMVLALQTGQALQDYHQAGNLGSWVAISMCREFGPVWVGVILAARVGSAMAAELGTMRVSEEIDALEVMSIDPAKFLVMPRLVGLTLMAPVLTVFANAVGILGGAIVSRYQIGVEYNVYFKSAREILEMKDLLGGLLIKAPVFGLTIATVGCTLGLNVKPSDGAGGVGSATRNSVVVALILLIIFNYTMSSFIRYL